MICIKRFTWICLIFAFSNMSCNQEPGKKEKEEIAEHVLGKKNQAIIKDKKSLKVSNHLQQSLRNIAKKVLPSVVDIRAEKKARPAQPFLRDFFSPHSEDFFEKHRKQSEKKRLSESIGSGFIIGKEGYIITNDHVIDGAINITVVLQNKNEYKARVIGKDKMTDLAVIKIKANKNIPTLSFGEASSIQVGSFAIAVGNPFGLSGSFTFGVISATGRTGIHIDKNAAFKHFIQTDASINQGNSGGPLLNIKGQVIGVNTAIYSTRGRGSVGIGFAVPVSTAKHVIRQLISKGRVDRGYIGVQPKDLDQAMAKHFKLERHKGVIIQRVLDDGPAHKAGVEVGDIILSVNGEGVKNTIHLIELISHIQPGKKAKLKILRQGKSIKLTINLGKRPSQITLSEKVIEGKKEKTSEDSWLGLSFGRSQDSVTSVPKALFKNEVMITGVDKDSPASKASKAIQIGDILETINFHPIKDMDDLKKVIKKMNGEKSYIFALLRKGQRIFTVVQARSIKK